MKEIKFVAALKVAREMKALSEEYRLAKEYFLKSRESMIKAAHNLPIGDEEENKRMRSLLSQNYGRLLDRYNTCVDRIISKAYEISRTPNEAKLLNEILNGNTNTNIGHIWIKLIAA